MKIPIPVRELDARGAVEYLAKRLGISRNEVQTTDLGGGVSNHVVLVETPDARFVLKQSLPKLRVREDWFSDRSRIFREAEALRVLAPDLPPGSVPEVLFEDRAEYAFAMSAAPATARTWKSELMNGTVSVAMARSVGNMHAALIASSWESEPMRANFGDQTAFDQLRLDPYYRFTARTHPDIAQRFEAAVDRCRSQAKCLVHGDWSPKNLLVWNSNVMAIDFEVIHFGDPAFDVAFLLNHLVLKSVYRPQSTSGYRAAALAYSEAITAQVPQWAWIQEGTLLHLPLLMLARVDGKSPAEYIQETALVERVREFARSLISNPPSSVAAVFDRLA